MSGRLDDRYIIRFNVSKVNIFLLVYRLKIMKATKSKKRGPGRPRKDTVAFHARVSRKTEERLREYMKRSGLKLGEAVEGAILKLRMPRRKVPSDDDA